MRRASISDAKNGLSALIETVKAGASVLIVDRGRPVARLEPVTHSDGTIDQLVREGIVRPGSGSIPRAITATEPPAAKRGVSVVRTLIDERRDGR